MFGQALEEPCMQLQHGRKLALFFVQLYIDHAESGGKVTMHLLNISENKGNSGRVHIAY
jgi:hypothetical protein